MSKRQKRLARLRQNPKNVSFDDLRLVLEDYGFRHVTTTGSHFSFSYTLGGQEELFTVPFRRPVKQIYVELALELIDQIIVEQGQEENEESDTPSDEGPDAE